MAALNYASSTRGPAGLLTVLATAARSFAHWIVAAHKDAQSRKQLLAMSERELDDIGLTRCDIDRVCRHRSLF